MLFYRIDDIGEDAPCDVEIIEVLEYVRVPYILAVIPTRLSQGMARRIQNLKYCTVFQHGFSHENAAVTGPSDEFPNTKIITRERLEAGKNHLEDKIACTVNGYTPPWNNASELALRVLEGLGFRWFSGHVRHAYRTTLLQLNVHIDPVKHYRPFCLSAIADLHQKLSRYPSVHDNIGIVLHPKLYPDSYRHLLEGFIKTTKSTAISVIEWRAFLDSY
jgi:hypothetical protein